MSTPLFFILGPCALESEEFAWECARRIKQIASRFDRKFFFKSSYDKANRTAGSSFRGPGVSEGTRILGEIGRELNVPVTTDVHTPRKSALQRTYRSDSNSRLPLQADRHYRGCHAGAQ